MTALKIQQPASRYSWCSDLHLNFVEPPQRAQFAEKLRSAQSDAIFISGDISDAKHIELHLAQIAEACRKPIFYVLGNHDFYHGSVSKTEVICARLSEKFPHLFRLTGREIVELSPRTALIGVDGWADGLAGSGPKTRVTLNDFIYIQDFVRCESRVEQFATMVKLARGFCDRLMPTLHEAMNSYSEVILLTHVPPVIGATWHQGKMSNAEYLPHFCNSTLGAALEDACEKFPISQLTVLCGHTHGGGRFVNGNLTILTAPAEYHYPKIEATIPVTG